jgi:hypothetical protein
LWLDPIISPQLATVATMLLAAVLVLSSTVSADGSISGVYSAGLQLAEQTQTQALSGNAKPVSSEQDFPPPPSQKKNGDQQQEQSGEKPDTNGHNDR